MAFSNYLTDTNPDALMYHPVYNHRVVWHGGQSTQLHFQILTGKGWMEINCQSFMQFPAGVKELLEACQDFYQSCLEEHGLNQN